MLKMTEGVDIPLGRVRSDREARFAAKSDAFKQECEEVCTGKNAARMHGDGSASKAEGSGPGRSGDEAARRSAKIRRGKGPGVDSRHRAGRVGEAPAYRAWNFAYINIPGPYEKNLPSIYYVSPPDPRWPKEEQDAYIPGGQLALHLGPRSLPGTFFAVSARESLAIENRTSVCRLRFLRRLGALHGRDDARRRTQRRRPGDAYRPIARRALAQRALSLGDRPAHARE